MTCKNSCAERVPPVKRQIRQARDQERQNCLFENASCFTSNNNVIYTPWHPDALPPNGLYSLSQGERGLYHQSTRARVALYCLFLLPPLTLENVAMAREKIRLGIIGANIHYGWGTRAHLPALTHLPDYEP